MLTFLDYHVPIDGDLLVLSLTERNLCYPLLLWLAGLGEGARGGLTVAFLSG